MSDRNSHQNGLEQLLILAAADERFAEELAAQPEQIAHACGVKLSASELGILKTVAPTILGQNAAGIRANMGEADRRQFMRRSAAALGGLLAGSITATGTGCKGKEKAAQQEAKAPLAPSPKGTPGSVPISDKPAPASPTSQPALDEILDSPLITRIPLNEPRALGIGTLGSRPDLPFSHKGAERWNVPRARVEITALDISERFAQEFAERILRRGVRCITASYQRALKPAPGCQGHVTLCIYVKRRGEVGRVTRVKVTRSEINNAELTANIRSCMKRLRFPPPAKIPAKICITLRLSSEQPQNAESRVPVPL